VHAERAVVREEFRTERLAELEGQIADHAANHGWSEQTADEVGAVLADTVEGITARLARVERAQAPWPDVKIRVRDYRLAQAERVREILGPEGFDAFVEELDLARFMGDDAVWGRLDR